MMKSIEFDAPFGDRMKHVEIAWPTGADGVIYISIDNYHEGQMVYQMGEWRAYLARRSELTSDDIAALTELIEESEEKFFT